MEEGTAAPGRQRVLHERGLPGPQRGALCWRPSAPQGGVGGRYYVVGEAASRGSTETELSTDAQAFFFSNRFCEPSHFRVEEGRGLACTWVAIARAVLRLSPVIRATSTPILFRVCTARAASGLTASAMAIIPQSSPAGAAQ